MSKITVFSNNGASLHFKNISNFKWTTKGFEFDYVGASTGDVQHASFDHTSTMGHSMTVD